MLTAALAITCLRDADAAAERLEAIAGRTGGSRMAAEASRVDAILEQVRQQGDAALLELSERFDGVRPDPLRLSEERLKQAWESCPTALQQALELAHRRILAFHEQQRPADLNLNGPHGELGSWSPPVPDARYRFRIRARAMIDKTGPNARPHDAARPDRWITLLVGLADWPRTGLVSDRTYFEMSTTEFREFEYVARVPKGKTLWVSPYRAVPESPDERAMVHGICAVIEWVEITNTRGMSQFADGGIVGTKPYVSSGAYLHKMGHYCGTCHYNVNDRTGPRACPFNALYWHFLARNRERFLSEEARPGMMVRLGMPYRTWDKMPASTRQALLDKGDDLLKHIEEL